MTTLEAASVQDRPHRTVKKSPKVDKRNPGARAVAEKGWLAAHKWLLIRRLCQLLVLGLFLTGPYFGIWIMKGTLASSTFLDVIPFTDPLIAVQSVIAGHPLETTAIIGVLVIAGFYALTNGRLYCSYVCPVNMVTDLAHWMRLKAGIQGGMKLNRNARWWVLGATFVAAAVTGSVTWEFVNPVTTMHRGIVFGSFLAGGLSLALVLAVFVFDLAVATRGWCSHLCPVGSFYGLIGHAGLLRVSAPKRSKCDQCMACYAVCPEPHVLTPALKGAPEGIGPIVSSTDCTACGRCIDVCSESVFVYTHRFDKTDDTA